MSIDLKSDFMLLQAERIARCYQLSVGQSLKKRLNIEEAIEGEALSIALYNAPVAILSHDAQIINGQRDNIYNYANDIALTLFERSFEEQAQLASTRSTGAESAPQADRNNLLAQCLAKGYVQFSTTRLSATGKLVALSDAILFNLFDVRGVYYGQAVVFDPPLTTGLGV